MLYSRDRMTVKKKMSDREVYFSIRWSVETPDRA